MKLACWNVNSINSRLDRALAFLQRHQPDVVCLQELKCQEDKYPFAEFEAAGYKSYIAGQKTYNGVALLSRDPIENIQIGFGDNVDDQEQRFISGRLNGTNILCGYIPNGQAVGSDKYYYKLNWLARLRRHLDQNYRSTDDIVLVGDFNIAPDDLDVHDPAAWKDQILCSTREREALTEICAFGLRDSYREKHPGVQQFTWWDYRNLGFPKNLGLRIDLILASDSMYQRLESISVDRDERKGEKPSDHAPVIASFSGK